MEAFNAVTIVEGHLRSVMNKPPMCLLCSGFNCKSSKLMGPWTKSLVISLKYFRNTESVTVVSYNVVCGPEYRFRLISAEAGQGGSMQRKYRWKNQWFLFFINKNPNVESRVNFRVTSVWLPLWVRTVSIKMRLNTACGNQSWWLAFIFWSKVSDKANLFADHDQVGGNIIFSQNDSGRFTNWAICNWTSQRPAKGVLERIWKCSHKWILKMNTRTVVK